MIAVSSKCCLHNVKTVKLSLLILVSFTVGSCLQDTEIKSVRVIEEIPEHIREIENLTIFPGDSEPEYSVEFIPIQRYGETGVSGRSRINNSTVNKDGRVLIWSATPSFHSIRIYNSDGTYHKQLGQPGRGPGEFERISSFQINADNIYLHDFANNRINIYSSDDYSFEKTVRIRDWSVLKHQAVRDMNFSTFHVRDDGNFLVSFVGYPEKGNIRPVLKFLLVDTNGDVLDSEQLELPHSYRLESRNRMGFTPHLTFLGSTIFTLSRRDEIYTAWTRDFLIKKYDETGRYQSAFYYPVKGPRFNLDSFGGWFGLSAKNIRNILLENNVEVPESYPALFTLKVDDEDRVWVAVTVEYLGVYEWWILSETGELIAKFLRRHDQPIFDIKNGYLYGKEIDEETGAEYVVKYQMEFREAW